MAVPDNPSAAATPLAVLGDSDSHGYRDQLWHKASEGARGGPYRSHTLQWTEVLSDLRGQWLDLGRVGTWGTYSKLGFLERWFGLPLRLPRKIDNEYNFAFAGARCDDLVQGPWRQAPRLARLMAADPQAWARGVVVIRVGVLQAGNLDQLNAYAANPQAPEAVATANRCADDIAQAVRLLQAAAPGVRMVLVGILDNADWQDWFGRWPEPGQRLNIAHGLDHFDNALRALAARSKGSVVFWDDRAWFDARWGAGKGVPGTEYRAVRLANGIVVDYRECDRPTCAILKDGHAGLAWNALWAQSLVGVLNQSFGLQVPPITDAEVAALVKRALDSVPGSP